MVWRQFSPPCLPFQANVSKQIVSIKIDERFFLVPADVVLFYHSECVLLNFEDYFW